MPQTEESEWYRGVQRTPKTPPTTAGNGLETKKTNKKKRKNEGAKRMKFDETTYRPTDLSLQLYWPHDKKKFEKKGREKELQRWRDGRIKCLLAPLGK